ncbi:MAG: ATP-binding cassette domain-containing protein [bacterium]
MALIETKNLGKKFVSERGFWGQATEWETAVRNVDLDIEKGETVGLVGESGCGKTTLARLILRLTDPSSGTIWFDGQQVDDMSQRQFRSIRERIQPVFQDPMDSLDPRYRVSQILDEAMYYLTDWSSSKRQQRSEKLMEEVGLNQNHLDRYPHQLSGGQRQRVGIARALAVHPDVVVCDEPTSALDVSIQAQIVNLLLDLKQEFDLTYVFISHDLRLVRFISDRISVMQQGEIVDSGPANELYENPGHDHTRELIDSLS